MGKEWLLSQQKTSAVGVAAALSDGMRCRDDPQRASLGGRRAFDLNTNSGSRNVTVDQGVTPDVQIRWNRILSSPSARKLLFYVDGFDEHHSGLVALPAKRPFGEATQDEEQGT